MATPPIDSLVDLINKKGLNVGNIVYSAAGAPVTASKLIYADSNSQLASGTIPFAIATTVAPDVTAASSTSSLLTLTGASTADVMTTTVVADGTGGATTFTKKGYIRINVTDTGDNITDGFYYIQVGTLT